jgi:hypothetical protein
MLSNILLTPFDREMRHKGYQLMRYGTTVRNEGARRIHELRNLLRAVLHER